MLRTMKYKGKSLVVINEKLNLLELIGTLFEH